MTPAEAQKALDRIISGPGSKADRARALFNLGCDRTEVVELLGMSYSQAHSIYKRLQDVKEDQASQVRGSGREDHRDEVRKGVHPFALRLSPSQTRIATHNGHEVIRVDREGGAICRNCQRAVTFSIKWLAFVHTDSKKDPTDLEDRYVD